MARQCIERGERMTQHIALYSGNDLTMTTIADVEEDSRENDNKLKTGVPHDEDPPVEHGKGATEVGGAAVTKPEADPDDGRSCPVE